MNGCRSAADSRGGWPTVATTAAAWLLLPKRHAELGGGLQQRLRLQVLRQWQAIHQAWSKRADALHNVQLVQLWATPQHRIHAYRRAGQRGEVRYDLRMRDG